MPLHIAIASIMPALTARPPSSPSTSLRSASRGNVVLRFVRRLLEADARARVRRQLRDLPDHLRADAGLAPRSDVERAIADMTLRIARSGRT